MKLSGSLWIWRDKAPDDPDTSGLSRRPTPRLPRHWLVLFTPSLGLLLIWQSLRFLPLMPVGFAGSVSGVILLAEWPAFAFGCLALGFWWRRRWVGDRIGHSIMAGIAILAFNIGALGVGSLLVHSIGSLLTDASSPKHFTQP